MEIWGENYEKGGNLMATIKLTKVEIGQPRYIVQQDGVPTEVSAEVFMVVDLEGKTVYNYDTWSKKIGFATPSKELSNNQYATQVNGHYWVKIQGWTMCKIPPEYISKGILSQAGIDYIKIWSGEDI